MSIHSLINPPPASAAGKKRKATDFEHEDETLVEVDEISATLMSNSNKTQEPTIDGSAAVEQLIQDAISGPTGTTKALEPAAVANAVMAPEPPHKKLRTMASRAALFGTGVAVGVLAGGVGALATLVSLPDGFFAS